MIKRRAGKMAVIFLSLYLMLHCVVAAKTNLLQQGIAQEVLRFHVLANSDSKVDQEIKLEVRDAVLAWLWEEEQNTPGLSGKEAEKAFVSSHLKEVEARANEVLKSCGAAYEAHAVIRRCYFPDRTYGACTFPAGWYEAVRLELGKAEGNNWWCVLYPRLCFTDCLHAVVEEKEMQQLSSVLTEEEYESLLHEPSKWHFTFRWFKNFSF